MAAALAGVDHEVIECDPDFADTAAFCERYGVDPQDSANAILVAGKGDPRRHALCLVLATTRLDVNRAVCRELGVRRASFASAEETREVTGMMIGGVTPFGIDTAIPLLIDARVVQRPSVVVGGGSRSAKVRMRGEALAQLPHARVLDDLATERE